MKNRVVITGLGALTGFGEGHELLWQNVLAKKTSISKIVLGESNNSIEMDAAWIRDFAAEKYIFNRKSLKVMARDIQLAVAAASLAIKDSQANPKTLVADRCGVIVGAGVFNHELDEMAYSIQNSVDSSFQLDLTKFGQEGMSALFPLWLLKYLPNMPACHISILFNFQGYNNTITTGASASLQAIGEAYRVIQRDDADLVIAGGADSKTNLVGFAQYRAMGLLGNNGSGALTIGEGAGFLVLESLEHALKRQAPIYAEICGFGNSSRKRLDLAMQSALDEARLNSENISYVQACALGLREEDALEEEAMNKIFKNTTKPQVGFSKPNIGFTGFASGSLDALISSLALKENIAPSIIDSGISKIFSNSGLKNEPIKYAMTNSFGLNGSSACVLTKKFERSSV